SPATVRGNQRRRVHQAKLRHAHVERLRALRGGRGRCSAREARAAHRDHSARASASRGRRSSWPWLASVSSWWYGPDDTRKKKSTCGGGIVAITPRQGWPEKVSDIRTMRPGSWCCVAESPGTRHGSR